MLTHTVFLFRFHISWISADFLFFLLYIFKHEIMISVINFIGVRLGMELSFRSKIVYEATPSIRELWVTHIDGI